MTQTDLRRVIEQNAAVIENFVMQYLLDNGIDVQLLAAIAQDLKVSAPNELLAPAIRDVVEVDAFTKPEFDLQRVINGGASLHFLARYARKVDPVVIPPDRIPSDEVIAAVLALFNTPKNMSLIVESVASEE